MFTSMLTRVDIVLGDKRIVDIACGSDHALALTSDGKVYGWGKNSGSVNNYKPRQLKGELEWTKIVHIACSSIFNMGVTDKGILYGWGYYRESEQIQSISIETPFIIDITSAKSLFGSGVATSANVQSEMHYIYPRKITAVSGKAIVKVACGLQHALVLTDEGELYAWGKNDRGQVGVNNNLQFCAPTMVDMPELVLDIAAYDNLSVAVGSNRIVYVWGDCFGRNIKAPIPTEFSRIHDAFAYTRMRVMHKPLTVSPNKNVEEVLNILESLGFGVLGTAFDDPVG
ncbi:rcc1 and btb domain-containing protein 1 [Lasius niger]|uniref:Rcc1 and btb domain-containing protein 1 n=1 Tax=Lasius niger TaxID=67767 RepID=A0A0J7K1B0_LASNI|nr:rcc1 and btb domain-containing protein 1 [Lasius niger]